MTKPWTGVTLRSRTADDGNVPRRFGASSPDIVLAGKSPLKDPAILTNPANYDKTYDKGLFANSRNYLYVRGKNFTSAELSGNWNLFWAEPNILLYSHLWEKNPIRTGAGRTGTKFSIGAGEIGATTDPFRWTPPRSEPVPHCLVGLARTRGHGNPLAGVTDMTRYIEIVANNANIAAYNVNMVRGEVRQVVAKAGYEQGSRGATVDLAAVFENIPKGSSYTVSSGTLLNGKALSHSDSNTVDNNFKYAWVNQNIPAQWNTVFTSTLIFGSDWSGIPSGARPRLSIRCELVQESTDPLYHLGYEADPDPLTGEPRLDATGGPVRLITVGSVSTVMADMGP